MYLSIAKSRASSPEPPELRLDEAETLTDSGNEVGRGSGCAHATGVGSEVVAATLLDKGDSGKNHGFFLGLVDAELGFDLNFGSDFDLPPFFQKARMAREELRGESRGLSFESRKEDMKRDGLVKY